MSRDRSTNQFGKRYYIFLLVFLGVLSAFGPFITDFYLPTLPSLASLFATTPSMVQLGLTTSMLGIAFGQLLFGPISDKYGRRPLLVASLLLFSVSTIAIIFSPTIEFFNMCRFFQGLGGSGGIVMSRSVATDCYSGRELAKTLALVGAINGIAPVVAPLIGGMVARSVGWQGIFIILLAIGVILLAMCFPFRESLPKGERVKGSVLKVASGFVRLFRLPLFNVYVACFGLAYGVLFSYISSATFIVQEHFGYSEMQFSLVFALNAIGSAIGSGLTMKFRKMQNAALFSTVGMAIAIALQLVATSLLDSFVIYELLTFLMMFALGFIFPSVTTLAMTEGRSAIGAASAIVGAIGFVFGGIVSPLVGIGDMLTTSVIVMLVSAVGSLLFASIGRNMLSRREKDEDVKCHVRT